MILRLSYQKLEELRQKNFPEFEYSSIDATAQTDQHPSVDDEKSEGNDNSVEGSLSEEEYAMNRYSPVPALLSPLPASPEMIDPRADDAKSAVEQIDHGLLSVKKSTVFEESSTVTESRTISEGARIVPEETRIVSEKAQKVSKEAKTISEETDNPYYSPGKVTVENRPILEEEKRKFFNSAVATTAVCAYCRRIGYDNGCDEHGRKLREKNEINKDEVIRLLQELKEEVRNSNAVENDHWAKLRGTLSTAYVDDRMKGPFNERKHLKENANYEESCLVQPIVVEMLPSNETTSSNPRYETENMRHIKRMPDHIVSQNQLQFYCVNKYKGKSAKKAGFKCSYKGIAVHESSQTRSSLRSKSLRQRNSSKNIFTVKAPSGRFHVTSVFKAKKKRRGKSRKISSTFENKHPWVQKLGELLLQGKYEDLCNLLPLIRSVELDKKASEFNKVVFGVKDKSSVSKCDLSSDILSPTQECPPISYSERNEQKKVSSINYASGKDINGFNSKLSKLTKKPAALQNEVLHVKAPKCQGRPTVPYEALPLLKYGHVNGRGQKNNKNSLHVNRNTGVSAKPSEDLILGENIEISPLEARELKRSESSSNSSSSSSTTTTFTTTTIIDHGILDDLSVTENKQSDNTEDGGSDVILNSPESMQCVIESCVGNFVKQHILGENKPGRQMEGTCSVLSECLTGNKSGNGGKLNYLDNDTVECHEMIPDSASSSYLLFSCYDNPDTLDTSKTSICSYGRSIAANTSNNIPSLNSEGKLQNGISEIPLHFPPWSSTSYCFEKNNDADTALSLQRENMIGVHSSPLSTVRGPWRFSEAGNRRLGMGCSKTASCSLDEKSSGLNSNGYNVARNSGADEKPSMTFSNLLQSGREMLNSPESKTCVSDVSCVLSNKQTSCDKLPWGYENGNENATPTAPEKSASPVRCIVSPTLGSNPSLFRDFKNIDHRRHYLRPNQGVRRYLRASDSPLIKLSMCQETSLPCEEKDPSSKTNEELSMVNDGSVKKKDSAKKILPGSQLKEEQVLEGPISPDGDSDYNSHLKTVVNPTKHNESPQQTSCTSSEIPKQDVTDSEEIFFEGLNNNAEITADKELGSTGFCEESLVLVESIEDNATKYLSEKSVPEKEELTFRERCRTTLGEFHVIKPPAHRIMPTKRKFVASELREILNPKKVKNTSQNSKEIEKEVSGDLTGLHSGEERTGEITSEETVTKSLSQNHHEGANVNIVREQEETATTEASNPFCRQGMKGRRKIFMKSVPLADNHESQSASPDVIEEIIPCVLNKPQRIAHMPKLPLVQNSEHVESNKMPPCEIRRNLRSMSQKESAYKPNPPARNSKLKQLKKVCGKMKMTSACNSGGNNVPNIILPNFGSACASDGMKFEVKKTFGNSIKRNLRMSDSLPVKLSRTSCTKEYVENIKTSEELLSTSQIQSVKKITRSPRKQKKVPLHSFSSSSSEDEKTESISRKQDNASTHSISFSSGKEDIESVPEKQKNSTSIQSSRAQSSALISPSKLKDTMENLCGFDVDDESLNETFSLEDVVADSPVTNNRSILIKEVSKSSLSSTVNEACPMNVASTAQTSTLNKTCRMNIPSAVQTSTPVKTSLKIVPFTTQNLTQIKDSPEIGPSVKASQVNVPSTASTSNPVEAFPMNIPSTAPTFNPNEASPINVPSTMQSLTKNPETSISISSEELDTSQELCERSSEEDVIQNEYKRPSPEINDEREDISVLSVALAKYLHSLKTKRKIKRIKKPANLKKKIVCNLEKLVVGGFSDSEFNEVVNACSTLKGRAWQVLVKYVVKSIKNIKKETYNNSFTPPAPPMTQTQQRMLALIMKLRNVYEPLIGEVMDRIQFILFRLGRAPNDNAVCSLARFYASICKLQCDPNRVLAFCYDAFYCLKFKAHSVVYYALCAYPEAFPRAEDESDSPIIQTLVYLIFTRGKPGVGKTVLLRNYLRNAYRYDINNSLKPEEFLPQLVEQIKSNPIPEVEQAFVLLAKSVYNWEWVYRKIIVCSFLPIIEDYQKGLVSDVVAVLTIKLYGILGKAFPPQAQSSCEVMMNLLESFLFSNCGSKCVKEATLYSITLLSRYNWLKAFKILKLWKTEARYSTELISLVEGFMKRKHPKYWFKFLGECEEISVKNV